jgi:hypothetical protein
MHEPEVSLCVGGVGWGGVGWGRQAFQEIAKIALENALPPSEREGLELSATTPSGGKCAC